MPKSENRFPCFICGRRFPPGKIFPVGTIRPNVLREIEKDHPDVQLTSYICQEDLAEYRVKYVQNLLVGEKGELSHLEEGVLESLKQQDLMSKEIHTDFEGKLTLGQKLADGIATFGGSWTFLISFFTFLLIWIAINSILLLLTKPFDPYPFILLNLLLSCLAAIQAPVIMMSQNRQEAKDRVRAEHDYQINLKAELEIRHLHEKVDHLLLQQWERLVEIQQVQIELLEELSARKDT